MPPGKTCSHIVLVVNDAREQITPRATPDAQSSLTLRQARNVLRGDTLQPLRDTAIELIRGRDPAKARSSYRFHLAIACDAHRGARTRAVSLDWLVANTASADQLGQARLDRLRSGAMTTGEPG